ncbi:hypothetical protein GHT09_018485 [Marmota monax]|uniref:Uncharacterized protein n=1 Tax=Marmota monax TaxID=9995 RepID=A0A834Q2Y2_MARMO|nr:hypothetical protein GHT09_018485 [Marmota monax]
MVSAPPRGFPQTFRNLNQSCSKSECLPQEAFPSNQRLPSYNLNHTHILQRNSEVRLKPLTTFASLEKIIKNEANPGLIVSNFVKLHKVKLLYNTKIQLSHLLRTCNVLDFFPLCKIRFSFEARVNLT